MKMMGFPPFSVRAKVSLVPKNSFTIDHPNLRTVPLHRRVQARDQILRQERRIARHSGHKAVVCCGEPALQAGQRPCKAADFIGNDAMAKSGVDVEILIGVDQELIHLGRETFDHPLHHRPVPQQLESLVDAAHAPAPAAGKDDTGDGFGARHASIVGVTLLMKRCLPVNSR